MHHASLHNGFYTLPSVGDGYGGAAVGILVDDRSVSTYVTVADAVANGGSILADVVPTKDEVDSGSVSL